MQFRPLPVLTAATLVSLVILIYLGNWQYQRYVEKMDIDIADGPQTEIVLLEPVSSPGMMAQQVYGLADSEPIWRRYVLARRSDDDGLVLLAVNATGGPVAVPVEASCFDTVEASVRIFERAGRDSGRNQPSEDTWYIFDNPGMAQRLGIDGAALPVAEPLEISVYDADALRERSECERAAPSDEVRQRRTGNPYSQPELVDPLPPQRHFGYAMTWWGLAAALLGVYFAFHASRGRLSFRSGK